MRCAIYPSTLLLLLGMGCGDDADRPPDPYGEDGGLVLDLGTGGDVGSGLDAGPAADTSFSDAGSHGNSGSACLSMGAAWVESAPVGVDEATQLAVRVGGDAAELSCLGQAHIPTGDPMPLCFTQCVDFLGYQPSPEQVQELEVDVFLAEDADGQPADPSFDPRTREERSPELRLAVGASLRSTSACSSGYQIELGYLEDGDGVFSQTAYVIRVRSRASAQPTWATLYAWDFVRQNDQLDALGTECGSYASRIPERQASFPIVAAVELQSAARRAGVEIPGIDNLFDGWGSGHVVLDALDCAPLGQPLAHTTVGFEPSARALQPWGASRHLALGIGEAETPFEARWAVGARRSELCTEALYGARISLFPDAVTFVRADREQTLPPVD